MLALSAYGCGPIRAGSAVIEAEEAVRVAEDADAIRLAPYQYWLSKSYLEKAKLTEGYADFDTAESFAEEAVRQAVRALDAARTAAHAQKILDERMKKNTPPSGTR